LWSTTNGIKNAVLKGHTKQINAISYSTDGKMLASGSDDMTVRVWSVADRRQQQIISSSTPVLAMAFQPDTPAVAFENNLNRVFLWDTTTNKKTAYNQTNGPLHAMTFSPNGALFVCAGNDHTLKIWQEVADATANPLHTLSGHIDTVTQLAFNPQGLFMVSAAQDNSIRLWGIHSP
jgi:WD40 repeat protein